MRDYTALALSGDFTAAAQVGMSGGPVRPPLLPPTQAEMDELTADLDAAGRLPGTGASRRITSNGHRPAAT
jgi:hypothetical protein